MNNADDPATCPRDVLLYNNDRDRNEKCPFVVAVISATSALKLLGVRRAFTPRSPRN